MLAAAVSACVPVSGEVSFAVGGEAAEVSITVRHDSLLAAGPGRPRSVSDERSDTEVIAAALASLESSPPPCSWLSSRDPSASFEVSDTSLTCRGTMAWDRSRSELPLEGPSSDLWEMRSALYEALVGEALRGYDSLPRPDALAYSDLELRERCLAGSRPACIGMVESASSGSLDELVGLLELREDLTGRVPDGWGPSPVQVSVTLSSAAEVIVEHNGTADAGEVRWDFVSERAGEFPLGLFALLEAPPLPEEDLEADSRSPLSLVLTLVLLAGIAAGSFLGVRSIIASRSKPKQKRLKQPKGR